MAEPAPTQEAMLGWIGLNHARSLGDGVSLFDVGAIDTANSSVAGAVLQGQVAVQFDRRVGAPDPHRKWVVSVLRIADVRNQLGGPLAMPVLRFWRYLDSPSGQSASTTTMIDERWQVTASTVHDLQTGLIWERNVKRHTIRTTPRHN